MTTDHYALPHAIDSPCYRLFNDAIDKQKPLCKRSLGPAVSLHAILLGQGLVPAGLGLNNTNGEHHLVVGSDYVSVDPSRGGIYWPPTLVILLVILLLMLLCGLTWSGQTSEGPHLLIIW